MNTCNKCKSVLPKIAFVVKNNRFTNLCKNCHNAYCRDNKKKRLTSYENRLLNDGMMVVYYNKNGVWERRFAKKINDTCVLDVCYFKYKDRIIFHDGDWLIKFGKTTLKATKLTFKLFYKLNKPE